MTDQIILISLYTLSAIFLLIGLIGCILPYPGGVFVFAACAVIPAGEKVFPWWLWLILIGLTLINTFADNLTTALGCKKQGGGSAAIWGSALGLFLGVFVPPFPIGLIAGAFIGAFIGEYLVAKKSVEDSTKIGIGATLGYMAGALLKLALSLLTVGAVALWLW